MKKFLPFYLVPYLLIVLLYANITNGQNPAYYKIDDEKGLPSNETYQIIQDDFGYIWIGCDAGLYRYDGFNFKQYSNSKQNGRGISFLQLDSKQRIWCKNFFGQIYRTDGDSLKIIKSFQTSNPSYPQYTLDNANNLWTYQSNHLVVNTDNGDSIASYLLPNHSQVEIVISLKYFDGFIFVMTSALNLYKFNISTKKFIDTPWFNKPFFTSQNCTFTHHKNNLFFFIESNDPTNRYSVYAIEEDTAKLYNRIDKLENNNRIYGICSDNQHLWVTSSFGIFRIDDSSEKHLLEKEKVSYMLKDKEGMFWFSTLHSGLIVIPTIEVVKYSDESNALKESIYTYVKATSEGKIAIGSYLGGTYEFDPNNKVIVEKYINNSVQVITVKALKSDEKYTIISRGRLCIVDNKTGKQFYPSGISNVRDFVAIGDTLFMVLTESIGKASISEMVKNRDVNLITINNFGGRAVEYDSLSKTFYFAMGNGTYMLKPNGSWEELLSNGGKVFSNALSYSNGIVWIASVADGVYGFHNNTKEYHFNSKLDFNKNNSRVIKATKKYIWVSTDNFLMRINYRKGQISKFDNSQSINPKDIKSIEVLNDFVYLATNKGLVVFPESMKMENNVAPNLEIENIYLNNIRLEKATEIKLPFNNSNFRINLTSTALRSRGNYHYRYRLVELDSNWTSIPASLNYALFSSIPSGIYHFQVKAINENNVESKMVSLRILVETPYWKSWWFFLLIAFLISGIVALFFVFRIRFIQRRAELKNKIIASQMTALKAQMNPHFMYNALNSIQDLVLSNDVKNSNLYLSRFSKLMRKILDASGKEEITLSDEIEILDLYLELEKLRFGSEFEYQIVVNQNINIYDTVIPSMIIQPFVENAIKHGLMHKKGLKKINIHFSLENVLLCTITDNGIGRKRADELKKRLSEKHKSFATQATQKRIELLNSYNNQKYHFEIIDLIEDEMPLGTQVIISIPISIS